jgi:hypothetical protein
MRPIADQVRWPMTSYRVEFPPYFDEVEHEITAKGYFADLMIIVGDRRFRPAFYDPVRLLQDIRDELASHGAFVERSVVVVEQVSRTSIEEAITELAKGDFQGIAQEI